MRLSRKILSAALAVLTAASVWAVPCAAYGADVQETDTAAEISIVRLGGSDRFATASRISSEGWENADTVVVANAFNYADALAGAPLAYALDAPILLTDKDSAVSDTTKEIQRLGAKKVIILGGTAAISDSVAASLEALKLEVDRIAGATRFETAEKIAKELKKTVGGFSEVFIASGVNYPDALSASSAAALKKVPILYSPKNGSISENTLALISGGDITTAYILGGEAAVGKAAESGLRGAGVSSVDRLGGSDRYDTSLKIAGKFVGEFKSGDIAFATGRNFPDALAGSVLAAKKSVPVVLTDNSTVSDAQKAYAAARNSSKAYVFGGETVVSDKVVNCFLGKAFMFAPKVSSVYIDEIFGKDIIAVWNNLVDAFLAGKDSFACPNDDIYTVVMHQFPDRCFPVMTELIEPYYGERIVKNGVAKFKYKTSKAEREKKLNEFIALVEDILNKTMKPEYSDLENALSLYEYFTTTYTYDYDTYNRLYVESILDFVSSYRLLTTGTGICQEISAAYSYLLMQTGADATIMMAKDHQWSYVKINGKNYHVDPTFGIGPLCKLDYFMMDDAKRAEDDFDPAKFIIASVYSVEHKHPDYKANDKTFSPIWGYWYKGFDHDTHTLTYYNFDEHINEIYHQFDYKDF